MIKKNKYASINLFDNITFNNKKQQLKSLISLPKKKYINSKYSFNTFIQGPSNEMAYSACYSILKYPGKNFNPLFIFSPPGTGKTHLLQSIYFIINKEKPNTNVFYLSAEQWVNSFIKAIKEKKFESFRKEYRLDCDILLIDDIQFLAGKDASQNEFFHTFNTLHQLEKQIVITSNKYPYEILGLEKKLQTRLSSGLIADIKPPEFETRLKILKQKAKVFNLYLNDEIFNFIATEITNSARELESAIIRLGAFKGINKINSLSIVKEFLSPLLKRKNNLISPKDIYQIVSKYFGLKSHNLTGKSRLKNIVMARQVAMKFCREQLKMSLSEIGKNFGGRNHTTVLSSLRKMEILLPNDIKLQNTITSISNIINNKIY